MRAYRVGGVLLLCGALAWLPPLVGVDTRAQSQSPAADLLEKAIRQLNLAIQQAVLAQVRSAPSEVHVHAQVVLNLLQGRGGPDYDATAAPDPGDGVGIIPYVERLRAEPELQGDANESVQLNLENVLWYLERAGEHAKNAREERSLAGAQGEMRQSLAFLSAAKGREQEITAAGGLLVLRIRLATPAGRPGTPQSEK